MNSLRQDAISIWNAGVDAVRAAPLVERVTKVDGDELTIGEHRWDLSRFQRILVVGAGKAATAMTEGLVQAIDGRLPVRGWINVPEGTEREIENVTVHPARPAGVNEPRAAGVAGTEAILRLVGEATESDLCIALISGGGSALLPAPAQGITLDDKLAVTRFLSAAGANIAQLNTVRKHLSRVKGGGLSAACRAGELTTLVLSDVLGDPLDLIASGPTVPDTSTPSDAIEVLTQFDPDRSLPSSIYKTLSSAQPKPSFDESTTIVIGNNQVAVDAAQAKAIELGYKCTSESATACEGLADDIGHNIAEQVCRWLRDDERGQPVCLISGGEPIVKLADESVRGKGGRNQQLVLAAYQFLLHQSIDETEWQRLAILSGGTDGEDGPTDAAGGLLDKDVHQQLLSSGADINSALASNSAYELLRQSDALLTSGPTGTNVCDLRVAVIH